MAEGSWCGYAEVFACMSLGKLHNLRLYRMRLNIYINRAHEAVRVTQSMRLMVAGNSQHAMET